MPKVKIKRKSTLIDMTAMCDVASLLLTFFILTATARQPEPLPVDIPSSTVTIKLPDTDISTLTVGQGKVFFGVVGQDVRINMLQRIGEKYGIEFTEQEKLRFSLIESFGVPVANLKEFIAMSGNDRNKVQQPGIPRDSTNNELDQWILQARYATKELHNQDLRFSIKGDSKEEYPVIRDVIDILQSQKINKFSLITSLEGLDR
ncbi:outer membrane transport energization protein ExbD [Pseudopedobacter saltans DSM 12145]|uniref:Outer membrane transport energization protein ExbD n=1 Tax=Pseudopedobacter saltans (strain ATCC 51119 / DSM 12145 / JCM 21818 / CCUG 39354 / LMG 10337 / NBRC 100064 / NCIMB 13643) TaxID=762903 RepID=F0S918_PSESL|nr:biopolymer transporter ExbD [Pseudopedobacter saltans]ADY53505.1 outer membrane transport energization protein ExbD [Pseudopedobacter saltans DSM 12145]